MYLNRECGERRPIPIPGPDEFSAISKFVMQQNILAKTIFQWAVTVSKSVSKKYREVIQGSVGLCLIC
jgi:hypothetical protein